MLETKNEEKKIVKILKPLDRKMNVLDVGCGIGKKYQLLESIGFKSIIGVETNEALVKNNIDNGRTVVTPGQFNERYGNSKFDLIVMSHVVEHFEWGELLEFIEYYLNTLKSNGYFLVISPVYHVTFYNDIDHVRPYLPGSIKNYFGGMEQVQIYPENKLDLIDISFRRAPFKSVFHKIYYVDSINHIPKLINFLSTVLFHLSFHTIGKTTGWIGLFKKA